MARASDFSQIDRIIEMDFIYIHKGYSWYVPLAIQNGKTFCRGEVHYLGDTYGCMIASCFGAKTGKISDYEIFARQFATFYRHYSTLGQEFELFCIQRWFILRDYMKSQGIKQAVYLDTDILVCESLDPFIEKFKGYGMTFSGYSAHLNFILDWSILDDFCRFVTELYSDSKNLPQLDQWYQKMLLNAGAGGVSDMTLFYWFHEKYPEKIARYQDFFEYSPFDGSLDDLRECEGDENGLKKIYWEANSAHVTLKTNQKKIKLATLHHQGRGKKVLHSNVLALGKNKVLPEFFLIMVAKLYGGLCRFYSKDK